MKIEFNSQITPLDHSFKAPDVIDNRRREVDPKFVLCRNSDGKPTAVFGEMQWDFNPYRTTQKYVPVIDFKTCPEEHIDSIKIALVDLVYRVQGGRTGRATVGTLLNYYYEIRRAARFSTELSKSKFIGKVDVFEVFSNPSFMRKYVVSELTSPHQITHFTTTYSALIRVNKKYRRVGLDAQDYVATLRKLRELPRQHLVIPPRIYNSLLDEIEELLERLHPRRFEIEEFIKEFKDPYFGRAPRSQKTKADGKIDWIRPDCVEAINKYELQEVFHGELSVKQFANVESAIAKIQYVMKMAIHIYTGMRDDEARAIENGAIENKPFKPISDMGHEDLVSVVSTTTKYHGYRARGAWLAPEQVVLAIEILESIGRALAVLWEVDPMDCKLLLSPNVIKNGPIKELVRGTSSQSQVKYIFHSTSIQADDINFLNEIEPHRDVHEDGVVVGAPWPLVSHQGRRSLAFYGASSGLISELTIKKQFKQVSLKMARYYGAGHERISLILGHYDKESGKYVMPKDHVFDDYRMAVPKAKAEALIRLVTSNNERLFGSAGSFIQKQRELYKGSTVKIAELRERTERQAENGEISYRRTILGGCLKLGRCEAFALGNFTECLGCADSIIEPERVTAVMPGLKQELDSFEEGTADYNILKEEYERLNAFQDTIIAKTG